MQDSWDRIRDILAAEASGRELRPAISQRTLFGIRSTVEEKMDAFAEEIEREQALKRETERLLPLVEYDLALDNTFHGEVYDIYCEAFPPEERFEWNDLLDAAHHELCHLTAYVDKNAEGDECVEEEAGGEVCCGFTFHINLDCAVYLLFLAVNGKIRSHGYGSRIINAIKRKAAGKPIVLEIEPLVEDAPNLEQRQRRLAFYQRNGFEKTGHLLLEDDMAYEMLSTDGFRDMEVFKAAFTQVDGLSDFIPLIVPTE